MIKEVLMYQTEDGELFEDKKQAEEHEALLKNIKCYVIFYSPARKEPDSSSDETIYESGNSLFRKKAYVLIHAKASHKMFFMDWLFKTLGGPIVFENGIRRSDEIIKSYTYRECERTEVIEDLVLAKIEEVGIKHIWDHSLNIELD